MKHIGTNKEREYDEPEIVDEVWVRGENGRLEKVEVQHEDDPQRQ